MKRVAGLAGVGVSLLLLATMVVSGVLVIGEGPSAAAQAVVTPGPEAQAPVQPKAAPVQPQVPPPVVDVLQSGVLIVISKASQKMYVFKDGDPWGSSPVSTGKRGHSTPAGVFPILQKKKFHRSNLYSNAPMPFMQRLTWGGIAIHAGRLPGYPASHGCIRLPYGFAQTLFGLTRSDSTTVVVTNAPVDSDDHAITLALGTQQPGPKLPGMAPVPPVMAATQEPSAPATQPAAVPPQGMAGPGQTIQLAAALSPGEAEAHWQALVIQHPELARFHKQVIPAVVGSRQYWRLRASAPGAHAYCTTLKRAGEDCFRVS